MTNDLTSTPEEPELPSLPQQILPALAELTDALGIPREVLASDREIAYAWQDLPRELAEIPPKLRGELIARMCVAVSTGLFDGAINYAWNATILHLRQMVREFGLGVVSQTLQKSFEENDLLKLQDNELINLALKLSLITEDAFFFLDQCRDIRNNFSAAHPAVGNINDREFTTFLNRCIRYALTADSVPRGIEPSSFIVAVKGERFDEAQKNVWLERLSETHDAQRELLFGTLHGIYCDPDTPQPGRLNALDLCSSYYPNFTAAIRADLVERHANYFAKGDMQRHGASQQFFEKLGALSLLNESERHSVIYKAVNRLWNTHQGMSNFYNEPPFAERLKSISEQGAIPETVQEQYVRVVVGCRIGNGYGVSWGAQPYYDDMIRAFSPREISIMLNLRYEKSIVGRKIQNTHSCWEYYIEAVKLVDRDSVPSALQGRYDDIVG